MIFDVLEHVKAPRVSLHHFLTSLFVSGLFLVVGRLNGAWGRLEIIVI